MLSSKEKELRRKGIGGSDLASIWKLEDAYMTEYELYENKVNGFEKPMDPALKLYLDRASRMEPYIAQEYMIETGEKVTFPKKTKFCKEFPHLLANVDGLIQGKRGVLELKTCHWTQRDQFGEPGTEEMPLRYMLQCAHYVMIYDYDYADLAVTIGTIEPVVYRYKRDKALEADIVRRTRKFWEDHVLAEKPPEPTTDDDLARIYTIEKGKKLDASKEILQKTVELKKIQDMRKKASWEEEQLKKEINLYMKDASLLSYEGVDIAKRIEVERKSVSGEALKQYNMKIFNELCRKSKYQKLTII
jgi:predicted phage-related endonuclease